MWITHSPDLSATDRKVLSDLAATGDHILVSQYDGLPSPVVATAWGKQLRLQSVTDPSCSSSSTSSRAARKPRSPV